ncbi:MAG: transcriptional regulator [Cetobacterium sp.]|uniref:transcriptional regulator n=1 Tax=Cetobacterium sp. TaxID=2071632 RepID=UPI003F3FCCD2
MNQTFVKNELLKVDDVIKICNVSKQKAYKLMKQVNDELESQGFITIKGRVNRTRLFKKLGILDQ